MSLKLTITSENDTVLAELVVEPKTYHDKKRTDVIFAELVVEYLSARFNCMKKLP